MQLSDDQLNGIFSKIGKALEKTVNKLAPIAAGAGGMMVGGPQAGFAAFGATKGIVAAGKSPKKIKASPLDEEQYYMQQQAMMQPANTIPSWVWPAVAAVAVAILIMNKRK